MSQHQPNQVDAAPAVPFEQRFVHFTPVLLVILALIGTYIDACTRRPPELPQPPPPVAAVQPTPQVKRFMATAYSIEGRTASGRRARHGIVAADPRVLPI